MDRVLPIKLDSWPDNTCPTDFAKAKLRAAVTGGPDPIAMTSKGVEAPQGFDVPVRIGNAGRDFK